MAGGLAHYIYAFVEVSALVVVSFHKVSESQNS